MKKIFVLFNMFIIMFCFTAVSVYAKQVTDQELQSSINSIISEYQLNDMISSVNISGDTITVTSEYGTQQYNYTNSQNIVITSSTQYTSDMDPELYSNKVSNDMFTLLIVYAGVAKANGLSFEDSVANVVNIALDKVIDILENGTDGSSVDIIEYIKKAEDSIVDEKYKSFSIAENYEVVDDNTITTNTVISINPDANYSAMTGSFNDLVNNSESIIQKIASYLPDLDLSDLNLDTISTGSATTTNTIVETGSADTSSTPTTTTTTVTTQDSTKQASKMPYTGVKGKNIIFTIAEVGLVVIMIGAIVINIKRKK